MEYNNHIVRSHFITDIQFYRSRKDNISHLVSNVSFSVSANEDSSVLDLLHFITREFTFASFSMNIQIDERTVRFASNKYIAGFIALLADYRYIKIRGKKYVFIDTDPNNKFSAKWLADLQEHTRALGFTELVFHIINGTTNTALILLDLTTIEHLDTDKMLIEKERETQLYFMATGEEAYVIQSGRLANLISKIDPITINLLMQRNQMNLLLEKKSDYIKYLENSIQSKTEYLSFVLRPMGNDEAIEMTPGMISDLQKIKNFYYNEYEILPLWYKRFGHLLKVIMGKRRIGSLFNDNTKNHK